jgi:hypothetical protein
MFEVKRMIGQETWNLNYDELTAMYVYVLNQVTWDYDFSNFDGEEHTNYASLSEVIPFLQDVLLHEISTCNSSMA